MPSDIQLKLLIQVAQESKSAVVGVAQDLKSIMDVLKGLDSTSLGQVKSQVQALSQVSRETKAEIAGLSATAKEGAEGVASLGEVVEGLTSKLKFLAGGFLALEGVKVFKEWADDAARAQVLATVLHTVGAGFGYTQAQLDATDHAVQRLGITAQASRQSLTQLMQANIDLSKATEIARVAQNLAVVSGENSSQTFMRLVHAIELRSVLDMRTLGITISLTDAENKYAASIGKTKDQLTLQEQQTAFYNAAMEKAKGLSGAYVAAMGDVGKQLTSLDRLTQTLSTSLGQQLLPSYLAIVQQLSLFIEELTANTDAANAASDGGERLGKIVGDVASNVRELTLFVIEHGKEILAVGAGYLLLTGRFGVVLTAGQALEKVFLTETALLVDNTVAIGNKAKALMALAGEEAAAADATTAAATATVAATDATEAATVATEGLTGAMAINPLTAWAVGLLAVTAALEHFLSKEKDAVAGATWIDEMHVGLKVLQEDLRNLGYLAIAATGDFRAFGKIHVGDEKDMLRQIVQDREQRQAGNDADAIKARYFTALENQTKLTQDLVEAQNHGNADQLKAAEDAYKKGQDVVTATEAAFRQNLSSGGLDPSRVKQDEAAAAAKRQQLANEKTLEDAEAARAKLLGGDSIAEDGRLTSKKFQEDLGDYTKQVEAFHVTGDKAAASIGNLREGFDHLAASVKTPEDLKQLQATLETVRKNDKLPGGALDGANTAVALARERVARAQEASTAPLATAARNRAKDADDATIEGLNRQLQLIQEGNAEKDKADQLSLNEGKISLDAYYTARLQRMKAGYDAETALTAAHIKAIQDQIAHTPDRQQRVALGNQLQAERDKQDVAAAKYQGEVAGLAISKTEQEIALKKQVDALNNQADKYYAGESVAISDITDKYAKLAVTLHGVAGAQEAIARARSAEMLQTQLDMISQPEAQSVASRTAQIGLEKSLVDSPNSGLNATQRQQADNNVVREQQQLIIEQIRAIQDQIQLWQNAKNQLIAGGASEADTAAVTTAMTNLQNKSEDLAKSFVDLQGQIHSAGQDLQKGFQSSLSKLFSSSFSNVMGTPKNLLTFAQNLQGQVGGQMGQHLAEEITTALSNHYSQKDAAGKPIAGTSPFDAIAKGLGLQTEKTLGSPENPTHTIVTNFPSALVAAAGGGGGGTVAKTAGVSGGGPSGGGTVASTAGMSTGGHSGGGTTAVTAGVSGASGAGAVNGNALLTGWGSGGGTSTSTSGTTSSVSGYSGGSGSGTGSNPAAAIASAAAGAYTGSSKTGTLANSVGTQAMSGSWTGALSAGIGGIPGAPKVSSGQLNTIFKSLGTIMNPNAAMNNLNSAAANQGNVAETNVEGDDSIPMESSPDDSGMFSSSGDDSGLDGSMDSDSSMDDGLDDGSGDAGSFADGGLISGPGTGRSDSISANVSNGEYVVNQASTSRYLPIIDAINNDTSGSGLQSIAPSSPGVPKFADGGLVNGQGSSSGSGSPGSLLVQLHPDSLNMTMSDWLASEVTRQYANR